MVGTYDRYLVAMATVIAIGGLASVHPAVATHEGLGAGSLLATLLLYEVLFRNPPTDPNRSRGTTSAIVMVGWVVTLLSVL